LRPFKKQQKQSNLSQQFKEPLSKASIATRAEHPCCSTSGTFTVPFPSHALHPQLLSTSFHLLLEAHLPPGNFRARNANPGINGAGPSSLPGPWERAGMGRSKG